jgi:hypothetical protein
MRTDLARAGNCGDVCIRAAVITPGRPFGGENEGRERALTRERPFVPAWGG